jgi:hypothetical protein
MPVIAEHSGVCKKSLAAFLRFAPGMSISHWDERFVSMQHRFLRHGKGVAKGAVVSRAGVVH